MPADLLAPFSRLPLAALPVMSEMDWPAGAREIARRELLDVLRETRALLARPGNDFLWSSWEDADAALAEVDGLIQPLESGRLPDRFSIDVLFLPTGPLQETALSSGWGDEFLALANRCDGALAILHPRPGFTQHDEWNGA